MRLKSILAAFLCMSLILPGNSLLAQEGDDPVPPPALETKKTAKSLEATITGGFEKIKDSLQLDFQNQPSRTSAGVSDVYHVEWPTEEGEKPKVITIFQSTSQIVRFDRPLARVALSDTSVCDITTLGTQEVLIYCTKPGRINLLAWDANYQVALYDIQAVIQYQNLEQILLGIDPKAELEIVPYGNSLAVYGSSSTVEKAKKMEEAIKSFNPRAISYVRVMNPKQILLEVRFAEIDRRANKEYGLDGELITRFSTYRSFTGETHDGSQGTEDENLFTPRGSVRTQGTLSAPAPSTANEFWDYTTRDFRLSGYLRWLEQKNVLRLIARPNIIALDGQAASFVVGGETPYITATTTSSNVSFKEFGTKLAFTPTIMDNEKIRLQMRVEVSELDFSTTVSLQGTTVPTLVKTTHQTVSELGDNETMVVGGLVNQRINRVEKGVPFLDKIPVLERIFKRTEFERKDVELLILCTPHLIEPFVNPNKKELYPPREALEATSVYVPAYPDLHGDMINRLVVQDERYHDFDGFALKRAKEVENEFVRIKKRDNIMEKALHKFGGIKIQEEIDPIPPAPAQLSESELFTEPLEKALLEADETTPDAALEPDLNSAITSAPPATKPAATPPLT